MGTICDRDRLREAGVFSPSRHSWLSRPAKLVIAGSDSSVCRHALSSLSLHHLISCINRPTQKCIVRGFEVDTLFLFRVYPLYSPWVCAYGCTLLVPRFLFIRLCQGKRPLSSWLAVWLAEMCGRVFSHQRSSEKRMHRRDADRGIGHRRSRMRWKRPDRHGLHGSHEELRSWMPVSHLFLYLFCF